MDCSSEDWCAGDAADGSVLEIRVHGVNNTAPEVMLNVDESDMCRVSPPAVTSFWRVKADREADAGVPAGVRREAYSWGGLVRPSQDGGTQRWWVMIRLVFQILALPFRVGNIAIWTRTLTLPGTTGAARIAAGATAGAARLFGLLLTLLFATTAAIVTIDFAALQCFAAGESCLLIPTAAQWQVTPGVALAIGSLGPIGAVGLLTFFAKRSRERYDTLGERSDALGARAKEAMAAAQSEGYESAVNPDEAIISHAAFWSNRITAHLARVHLAAAIALTSVVVALHTIGSGEGAAIAVLVAASTVLLATGVASSAFPTMSITPTTTGGGRLPAVASWILVVASVVIFAALFVWLVFGDPVVGAANSALVSPWLSFTLIAGAAVIAATGSFWRRGDDRDVVAWRGTGPGIIMVLSLGLAVVTSAATITVASLFLRWTWDIPGAAFAGDWAPALDWLLDGPGTLQNPLAFVYSGGLCAAAIVVVILYVVALRLPGKSFGDRLTAWAVADSPADLAKSIGSARRNASLIQSVEHIALVLCTAFSLAFAIGLYVAGATLIHAPTRGIGWLPNFAAVTTAVVGVGLAAAIYVVTILRPASSIVAIVWDVACFVPRTAQPFGPPCYAERAVPELADRIICWLNDNGERKVVLAAHSMGAVVAVASLGMLRHEGSDLLQRIAFLTYGVQLRTYFGRILPELLGPQVIGVFPARMPSPWRPSPWQNDDVPQRRAWHVPASAKNIGGSLLPPPGVRWLSLWRLTDYLGFPAFAGWKERVGSADDSDATPPVALANEIDRYAEEYLDDPREVATHSFYERSGAYATALTDLVSHLEARVGQR